MQSQCGRGLAPSHSGSRGGSFGPNLLDKTFGPEVVFEKAPPEQNTSPFAGFQFFGEVNIDGQTGELTVILRDLDGVSVFEQKLQPT